VLDTFVSKEDSDFFATAVNTEVNEFGHLFGYFQLTD
jgi:hypothetical protein